MTSDLLQIDVELLLCRYGRSRVLTALAVAEGCSEKELQKKVADARVRREQKTNRRSVVSLLQRLETELKNDPEKLKLLRPVVLGFDNGRVLPTLKSIHRFLESRGESPLAVKSRKAAGPAVLRALRLMTSQELTELESGGRHGTDDNDFALLSEAILKPSRRT